MNDIGRWDVGPFLPGKHGGELLAFGAALELATSAYAYGDPGRRQYIAQVPRELVPIFVNVGHGVGVWIGVLDVDTNIAQIEFQPLTDRQQHDRPSEETRHPRHD